MPACAAILALYALIFVLHLIVPGRWVDGYVQDERGQPLRYRLNGLRVMAITIGLYLLGGLAGLFPWDYLYLHRWESALTACALGLAFTAAIVFTAPPRGPLLADLYLGRRDNPRILGGHLDAKMFLYVIGAVVLELNLLACLAHHWLLYPGDPSPGMFLHVALFSFFLCEYLYFERVHLYTYDLFAECVGFKLGWGCLCFYAFFYAVGAWSLAAAPNPHTSFSGLLLSALVFFTGWALARGANLQKYFFKRDPTRPAFGLLQPEAIEHDGRRLLVNGFWGLSRHINYLGEILMATGLALALGYPAALGPWLYPLYYVGLLFPRQYQDDLRCAEKYGPLWTAYTRRVRWRIIPGIY